MEEDLLNYMPRRNGMEIFEHPGCVMRLPLRGPSLWSRVTKTTVCDNSKFIRMYRKAKINRSNDPQQLRRLPFAEGLCVHDGSMPTHYNRITRYERQADGISGNNITTYRPKERKAWQIDSTLHADETAITHTSMANSARSQSACVTKAINRPSQSKQKQKSGCTSKWTQKIPHKLHAKMEIIGYSHSNNSLQGGALHPCSTLIGSADSGNPARPQDSVLNSTVLLDRSEQPLSSPPILQIVIMFL